MVSVWGETDPVSGCRFEGCLYGVVQTSNTMQGMTVKNCLFRDIWNSAVQVSSTATVTWPCTVLNCTVFRTWRGVECSAGAEATVRNCILTSCTSYGIWKDASASVSESYNSFWLNANNASFSPLNGNDRTDDPKFVNTTVADLYERFYLNQGPSTTSPCVIYGNPNDARFLTTALDKDLDTSPVDIGYHYPVRGHLHVTPSYFFEFEDGEPFYPISAMNEPDPLEDLWTGSDANFYPTTVPLYLQTLAQHGFNTMRVYTSRKSLSLQFAESLAQYYPVGDDFVTTTVKALDKYFDALENKGFVYSLVNYDSEALRRWYCLYMDDRTSPASPPDSRYLAAGTPPFQSGERPATYPGTVAATTATFFFWEDAGARTARQDFKHSLWRFLDSQHASPKWWTRKGLIGWDLFSEIDNPEVGWEWDEPISSNTAQREITVNGWMTAIAGYIADTERLRLGSERLRTVDVGNLQRFNWWDPDIGTAARQAAYLDNPLNDYIDYHLYTWNRSVPASQWFTEYPQDAYTPIKYYLGVSVGVQEDLRSSSCTLPEVIDYNRQHGRGFFSSEFALTRWEDPATSGYARKRLINDCYHNYIWLAFATGSVGGPTPKWPAPGPVKPYYDLSGINYLNPAGEALNCYTDEILDSVRSLSRFTSLVNWKLIGALYRPMRITKDSGGAGLELRSTTSGLVLPENEWLWSAGSDKTFTVGWIVRNCPRDYGTPEWNDALTTKTAPRVHITGLQATAPSLELVWFDDHLGQIVGSRTYSTSGTFNVVTPNTEGKNGFARSIAFLIQPTGLTASKSYAALPDEKIGMIGATPLDSNEKWYEEGQKVLAGPLTFTVRTKPATNPSGLTFEWRFDSDTTAPIVVSGEDHIHRTYTASEEGRFVKVDIKDQQNKRVSGDITYVWVKPN